VVQAPVQVAGGFADDLMKLWIAQPLNLFDGHKLYNLSGHGGLCSMKLGF
jgi:hypothetical protein